MLVHDDNYFLKESLQSFASLTDRFVFVSSVPWSGTPGDCEASTQIARDAGCTVVEGVWDSEHSHRAAAYEHLRGLGFTHALIADSDEVIEPGLLKTLIQIAEQDLADRVYVEWDTYWKDPYHVVRPREAFTPCILINLERAHNVALRHFEGGRALLLNQGYGIIHHLSYVGPDERIARKISSWSHKDEVVPGWWDRVWKGWDKDKRMGHLHPTHPPAYQFVEHIYLPEVLAGTGFQPEAPSSLNVPESWPTVSVVIPLHGGEDDIKACLSSLSACFSLIHEVIVVDNGSKDDAASISKELLRTLPGGRLIELGENRGFAHACNRGSNEAAGEIVLFLNSDTIVPRSGLRELILSLQKSGTIGAAGPYTNNAGHHQPTHTTYTSEATIDLFADDFAEGPGNDRDVDMLVGFCLAVRKSALREVGLFDEAFGLGLFEDNDLCYRLRREGYRLVLSGKSFVHHAGSKTLNRVTPNAGALLAANQARFMKKWAMDLESGFSNGLSGMSPQSILFLPANKPETRLEAIRQRATVADISLCMIVKNEERVLSDCLRSAKPFFKETIIADTGSTDSTRAIAESFDARVVEFPWTDSFSEARNASLAPATGKWICWLDADDTLPLASGEAILNAVLSAPDDVAAFVVPVRFTDGGESGGVQVDHVKVFRNLPGIAFEGRIHEQILRTLKSAAGQDAKIVRLDAVVLHSGYDTSEEGQKRKRERDSKLLKLDLEERPDHPFVLFNLGMTAHYTEGHDEAIGWLEKCLAVSDSAESHVRKAYAMLGVSLERTGRPDDALVMWETGLSRCPGDPELHFQIARIKSDRGELVQAREHYLATLGADIAGIYTSVDRGILGYKTMHNLAQVEAQLGNYEGALKWFSKAVECAPEFRPSAFSLFDLALQHGDLKTAKRMLSFIESQEGQSPSWQGMRNALLDFKGI